MPPAARSNGRTFRRVFAASLVGAALATQVQAAANNWTNGAATGNFGDAGNWSGVLSTTDTLTFPVAPPGPGVGSGITNLTNNSGISTFAGVAFAAGAGNYTITTTGTANYGTVTGANSGANRGGVFKFVSVYSGSPTVQTLNIGANNSIGDGNILNLVPSGGTYGTDNKFVLSGAQLGFLRSRDIFDTTNYAYNDTVLGYVRAPVYGTDPTFVNAGAGLIAGTDAAKSHNLVSTSITGQISVTVNTIKFGAGTVDLTQNAATVITSGTAGAGSSAGGILRSGGGSTTISGGTLQMGAGNNGYIHTAASNDILIINSVFQNNGALVVNTTNIDKTGAGTLVLGGANTYGGNTWIDEGTLLVTGTHTSLVGGAVGSYFVNPGAILGGTGTSTTTLTNFVQNNGTIAPGNSLGATPDLQTGKLTLNTSAVNFTNGSSFAAQLGGTTAGSFDQLALTNTAGAISLTGSVTLSLTWVGAGSPLGTYLIIDTSLFTTAPTWGTLFNGTTNGGTVGISGLPGGYTSTIGYAANGITITVIPEPQEYAIGIAAMLGLVAFLRNRRRNCVA